MLPINLMMKWLKRSTGSPEGKDLCMRLSCFGMKSLSNHLHTRSHAMRIHCLLRQKTVENGISQIYSGSEQGMNTLPSLTMTQPTAGFGSVLPRPLRAWASACLMYCLSASVMPEPVTTADLQVFVCFLTVDTADSKLLTVLC